MKWLRYYRDSFRGLDRAIWYLSLITLINRAGTMVVPFLALYLTHEKNFTLESVGWIMSSFGLGSVVGAWIGGKLTEKIGFHKVMYFSLLGSGMMFILLGFQDQLWSLSVGSFLLMVIADSFRPAATVAITTYAGEKNRMRSISLHRLAINLGFSVGPATGGFLITQFGYQSLFWVDGITCFIAGLLLITLLGQKSAKHTLTVNDQAQKVSPYRDYPYLLLVLIVFLTAFCFLQMFSTVPLYLKDIAKLSEAQIGWLMTLNGAVIFLIEMPIVKELHQEKYSAYSIITWSLLLIGGSFLLLLPNPNWFFLILSMLFFTVGEIFNFPFLNNIAINRSKKGSMGEYMALYTIAFAIATIVAHKSGLFSIDQFGFSTTWIIMAVICLIAIGVLFIAKKRLDS